jgi:dephospho-CoA kinase
MHKIVLGITGEIAAGKGTATKYLEEKYGASQHRFSTMLRDVAKRMHLEENRENLQKISTLFRENFSDDLLSQVIFHDVEADTAETVVIDGVRRMSDIEYLKKLPGFRLVYIETAMEKRYERLTHRGENTDDAGKTFEEFKLDNEREAERKIKDLKADANFVVDNNGNLEELFGQIDNIIEKCKA